MSNVGITGLGHYLPKRKLTNADIEKLVDTTDEWITTRTGIRERRLAGKKERTSDLAVRAGREALKSAKLNADKVDLIVVATISPDSNFPSVACLVQKAIGAHRAAGRTCPIHRLCRDAGAHALDTWLSPCRHLGRSVDCRGVAEKCDSYGISVEPHRPGAQRFGRADTTGGLCR